MRKVKLYELLATVLRSADTHPAVPAEAAKGTLRPDHNAQYSSRSASLSGSKH